MAEIWCGVDNVAKEFFPQLRTYLLRYFVPNIHGLTTWLIMISKSINPKLFSFPPIPSWHFMTKDGVQYYSFILVAVFVSLQLSHWWFCSTLNISKTINWDQSFVKVQNESIERLWPLSALILRNWNLFHTTSFLLGFRIQAKPMFFFPNGYRRP